MEVHVKGNVLRMGPVGETGWRRLDVEVGKNGASVPEMRGSEVASVVQVLAAPSVAFGSVFDGLCRVVGLEETRRDRDGREMRFYRTALICGGNGKR